MIISYDQMQQRLEFSKHPHRIISLVPSLTELLFDLGLDDKIVGVTQFCIHPSAAKMKPKIGGTKRFLFEKIHELNPDILIGNKEENYQKGIERLKTEFPVWMSDIATLEDTYALIKTLGVLLACELPAEKMIQKIKDGFIQLKSEAYKSLTVAYFIWRKPYMVVAKDTFIDTLLHEAGFANVFEDKHRYPKFTSEGLKPYQPDLVLLSSEPYPFKREHFQEFKDLFPNAKVIKVDGEMFSWYGSRLQYAPEYFRKLRAQIAM